MHKQSEIKTNNRIKTQWHKAGYITEYNKGCDNDCHSPLYLYLIIGSLSVGIFLTTQGVGNGEVYDLDV